MVEADVEAHVVLATPPSVFDAAVVARTLYTGLGPRGWRLTIIGMGGRLPARLLEYSRIPVSVALVRIELGGGLEGVGGRRVYVVDTARGEPCSGMEPPDTLLVSYSGRLPEAEGGEWRRIRCLGLPSLTYEAVAAIYEFWIRRSAGGPEAEPYSRDPRQGLYLARKLSEALLDLDGYTVVAPNVLVFTLRRVYLERGMILDQDTTRIEVDHVEGVVREEVRARLYSRRGFREAGEVTAIYSRGVLEVRDPWGLAFRIIIQGSRLCCAPGLCVEAQKPR